ncbi:type VI secretion system tip protein VgrG [Niveispirillum sp. SYP-B3756]|uniref:type VI secretion system Vgr family protein n=1 Tax=Niveispirillum sp. SYP-B3756 TaxID=2662178 RepID=UPI001291F079|nr:type VI secretion system tip protein TssI/VgrG [Niveispirillum sp. SYP-B3756]MQP64863.1 type VI secretion system tip protein VgrG [Niveispirillum sp. SYP-B3756]
MDQENRLLRLHTLLGQDRLIIAALSGEEGLSTPFHFRLEAFSIGSPVDLAGLVGRPVVVSVRSGAGDYDRHFHGYVANACYRGRDFAADQFHYELDMVPWLWFLSRRSDSRIFQGRNAIEIAQEIFRELGFSDVEVTLESQPPVRPYCVQYRESDLDFLSRLWEEDGIHYFFRHEADRHVLVLADGPSAHQPFAGTGALQVKRGDMADAQAGVTKLLERRQVVPGRYAVGDHNFETPRRDLLAMRSEASPAGHSTALEQFDHPAGHQDLADADRLARLAQERWETARRQFDGNSNEPRLACGNRVLLSGHELADYDGSYLLLSVHHSASNDMAGGGGHYNNSFIALPTAIPYRPQRYHPRPVVEGPQTATVVGPAGQEIHTDAYGRIRVSFHWDRRSKGDEGSSCWIRVAQPLAGGRWGGMAVPRVGMEVVVSFLDGNPDRPIVTGCVYNADNMPPYPLPANKTRLVLKSRSSPNASGFNEIRLEDKAGAEQVFIQAQRDLDLRVRARRRALIGGGDHLSVGGDRRALVQGNDSQEAKRDIRIRTGEDWSLDAGSDIHIRANTVMAVKAGQQLVLHAGSGLTLKSGGSFITIGPAGIAVSGPMVRINSGGSPAGVTADPERPERPQTPPTAEGGRDIVPPGRRLVRPSGNLERIAQIQTMVTAATNGVPFAALCGGG